jgi:teichuronic acid biosynthesis glycosyltransferase TuaG
MNPEVSVIMPAHNSQDTLQDAVQSVRNQTFSSWELLLVVDAKSSDHTLALAQKLARQEDRLRLITGPSGGGCAHNRNAAMQQARARHLAFLDSDDLWHPLKLQRQLSAMREQDAALSCTGYGWMDSSGRPRDTVMLPPARVDFEAMLRRNWMGCLTVMLDRHQCGNPSFKEALHEDYILWLELTRQHWALGLRENLATYRLSKLSRSGDKLKAAKQHWTILRQHAGQPIIKCVFLFAWYSMHSLYSRIR